MWVNTVDCDEESHNFNLDLTWEIRSVGYREIRFRKHVGNGEFVDVEYKTKEIRDIELKRIQAILAKGSANVD